MFNPFGGNIGGGGGEGGFSIAQGPGISIKGSDTKVITNSGVRSITQNEDGTLIIDTNGTEEKISISTKQLRAGTVKTCVEKGVPVKEYNVGDKYIDIIVDKDGKLNNADDEHVYILVSELSSAEAEKIAFKKDSDSIITSTNVEDALNEIGILATPKTNTEEGKNGLMSGYDKNKLDNIATFANDTSMKLAIDGLFSGYDMSAINPDDEDGIADKEDIDDIFDKTESIIIKDAVTQGSFTSLSAEEIDDMF